MKREHRSATSTKDEIHATVSDELPSSGCAFILAQREKAKSGYDSGASPLQRPLFPSSIALAQALWLNETGQESTVTRLSNKR